MRLSWNQNESVYVSREDIMFSIVLKSSLGGLLSHRISIADQLLKPEVYLENLEIAGLHLINHKTKSEARERNIFYVAPNPIKSTASIHFYVKEEGLVEFRFFDFAGKLLFGIAKNYSKGEQIEEIKVDGFPSGIIFCQILHTGSSGVEMFIKTD